VGACYFTKISKNSTIKDVVASMQLQEERKLKKIQFDTISEITLKRQDFERLLQPLSQSNILYAKYGDASSIGVSSIFPCISIVDMASSAQLIVYTGGHSFPVYMSFESSKDIEHFNTIPLYKGRPALSTIFGAHSKYEALFQGECIKLDNGFKSHGLPFPVFHLCV